MSNSISFPKTCAKPVLLKEKIIVRMKHIPDLHNLCLTACFSPFDSITYVDVTHPFFCLQSPLQETSRWASLLYRRLEKNSPVLLKPRNPGWTKVSVSVCFLQMVIHSNCTRNVQRQHASIFGTFPLVTIHLNDHLCKSGIEKVISSWLLRLQLVY